MTASAAITPKIVSSLQKDILLHKNEFAELNRHRLYWSAFKRGNRETALVGTNSSKLMDKYWADLMFW